MTNAFRMAAIAVVAAAVTLAPRTSDLSHAAAPSSWPMAGANPAQSNFNAAEHSLRPEKLKLLWRTSNIFGPYIVAAGQVFSLGAGQRLASWDAHTGKLRHTYFKSNALGLGYAGGRLYVGGDELRAINPANGDRSFQSHVSTHGARGALLYPVIGDGAVFTATGSPARQYISRHYAFDARNGRVLWSQPRYDSSIPCLLGNRVYMAYQPGEGVAYAARTGRVVWRQHGVGYSWMASSGMLFTSLLSPGRTGEAKGFTTEGKSVWTAKDIQLSAAAYGRVYGVRGSGFADVVALDARTGKQLWVNYGARPQPSEFAMAVANGVVYVIRNNGDLLALDAATGRTRSITYAPPGYTDANFLEVAGGMVYENAVRMVKSKRPPVDLLAFGR